MVVRHEEHLFDHWPALLPDDVCLSVVRRGLDQEATSLPSLFLAHGDHASRLLQAQHTALFVFLLIFNLVSIAVLVPEVRFRRFRYLELLVMVVRSIDDVFESERPLGHKSTRPVVVDEAFKAIA